jgi:hypothetical protein
MVSHPVRMSKSSGRSRRTVSTEQSRKKHSSVSTNHNHTPPDDSDDQRGQSATASAKGPTEVNESSTQCETLGDQDSIPPANEIVSNYLKSGYTLSTTPQMPQVEAQWKRLRAQVKDCISSKYVIMMDLNLRYATTPFDRDQKTESLQACSLALGILLSEIVEPRLLDRVLTFRSIQLSR